MIRQPVVAAAMAAILAGTAAGTQAPQQSARGRDGMVATTSPTATAAAVEILEGGGNAVDAAAAAHFALMVSDPANTSVGGRVQVLIAMSDGRLFGIDGATRAPAGVMPLEDAADDRQGFEVAPVPGAPAALAQAVARHGRLPLADVMRPAIALARDGFEVTPRLAASWARTRDALRRDPGAAQTFLKPDGSAYRAGEMFEQPRLARVLQLIATSGGDALYRGTLAEAIVRDVTSKGGAISLADLRDYKPLAPPIVTTNYRGYDVAALGGRAWGDTLVQMLNMLEEFSIGPGVPTAKEIEVLARVMGQALEDRPQEIGTLKPKPGGHALATLSSRAFARERAAAIRAAIEANRVPAAEDASQDWADTTHLSVMDRDGNAVSLTTSVGPSFGSRVATPELGFLYAHSYRMRAAPLPGARDETEMAPTIVLRDRRPVLALGAAGSERIPTAILQVMSHVIDRHATVERAIAEPRIYSFGRTIRAQPAMGPDLLAALGARGFSMQVEDVSLGTVQVVQFLTGSGEFAGAADPRYDGTAAAPRIASPRR